MTKSQRVTWKALAIRAMSSHPKKRQLRKGQKKQEQIKGLMKKGK